VALAVGLLALGSAACEPPPAAPRTGTAAELAQLTALINNFRAAHGVGPLATASDATAKAQQHATDMAAARSLFHSSSLTSGLQPGAHAFGENICVASTVSQIESILEGSPPHRDTMLSTRYNQLGVGIAYGSDGRIYVSETFVGR